MRSFVADAAGNRLWHADSTSQYAFPLWERCFFECHIVLRSRCSNGSFGNLLAVVTPSQWLRHTGSYFLMVVVGASEAPRISLARTISRQVVRR